MRDYDMQKNCRGVDSSVQGPRVGRDSRKHRIKKKMNEEPGDNVHICSVTMSLAHRVA
jgi:hypothetical protein